MNDAAKTKAQLLQELVALRQKYADLERTTHANMPQGERNRWSQSFMPLVVDHLPMQIAYVDRDLRHRFVNKQFERWFNLPENAIVGKPLEDLMSQRAYQQLAPYLEAVLSGREVAFEQQTTAQDGGARQVSVQYIPHRDEQGTVLGFISIAEDTTERKRVETQLRESESKLRSLLENAIQPVFIQRGGQFLYANQALADLFGFDSPDDFLQVDSILDLVAPHERPGVAQRIQARIEQGEPPTRYRQMQALHRDGSLFWVEYIVTIVSWNDAPADMVTIMDMTARKQAEGQLQASEARFRDLVEGSIQGILIYQHHKTVFVNASFAEIFGYASANDIYQLSSLLEIIAPSDHERMLQYRDDRIAGRDAPSHYEFQGVKRDGSRIWLDAIVRVVHWYGEPAIQITVFDKTASKAAEEALRRSDRLAMLGQMAATFSHEVRNPLQSLLLYASILEEEINDSLSEAASTSRATINYALDVMREQATRMSDIAQDYLSLARLDLMHLEPQDMGAFISEVMREKQETLTRRGLTLRLEGIEDLGMASIHTSTFRRALLNIVQNAMEAMGSDGYLTIRGGQRDDQLQIVISDTGAGMAPVSLSEIFTPFYTTKLEGTGLGLYVAQEIVDAHNGEIEVESEPGRGTTFTITLPQAFGC